MLVCMFRLALPGVCLRVAKVVRELIPSSVSQLLRSCVDFWRMACKRKTKKFCCARLPDTPPGCRFLVHRWHPKHVLGKKMQQKLFIGNRSEIVRCHDHPCRLFCRWAPENVYNRPSQITVDVHCRELFQRSIAPPSGMNWGQPWHTTLHAWHPRIDLVSFNFALARLHASRKPFRAGETNPMLKSQSSKYKRTICSN